MNCSSARRLGALAFVTLCPCLPHAARASDADEVVVSATRTERALDAVPADVTVLTAATLETRVFDRLDEALSAEAGIYGGRVRGTSSTSHTLIMLNGMPLNSGWYGGVNWQNVSMENVARIEILRGPASALYGGNAMGGAINIITGMPKQFEANLQTSVGSDDHNSWRASIGDKYGRLAVRLGAEYDNDLVGRPVDYVFRPVSAGAGTLTGGESSLNRQGRDYWIVGDKGEHHEREWSANLSAAYDLTDTGNVRFDWQNGHSHYDNGPPSSYVSDPAGQAAFSGSVVAGSNRRVTIDPSLFLAGNGMDDNSATLLTYTEQIASVAVVAKVGYQHENKWYTTVNANSGDYFTASGSVREFDTGTAFSDLQGTTQIGTRVTLTGGVSAKRNQFDQDQYDVVSYRDDRTKSGPVTELTQGSDRYYAAFLQGELTLTSSLKAYVGGRYDTWSASHGLSGPALSPLKLADADDSAFSPSASLVWEASDATIVHASVARAFSPPNIYDRYRTFVSGSTLFLSNPDLRSESLLNHEIGVVQYLWDRRVRAQLTGFLMHYRNLVYSNTMDDVTDIDGNPATTVVTSSANAGRARNVGFELTLNAKVASWLDVWGNYSENHTRITRNALAPTTVGKRFTYSPDRGASVGADARYRWVKASVISTYTGHIFRSADNSDRWWGVYQSDSVRWLTDLKLSADLPARTVGAQAMTVSFAVRNLFDRDYFEYTIGRPRSYYLEAGLRF
jgi:iron complex outermembrane receptor protein